MADLPSKLLIREIEKLGARERRILIVMLERDEIPLPEDKPEMLGLTASAEYLKIQYKTFKEHVAAGRLVPDKVTEGDWPSSPPRYFFLPATLDAFRPSIAKTPRAERMAQSPPIRLPESNAEWVKVLNFLYTSDAPNVWPEVYIERLRQAIPDCAPKWGRKIYTLLEYALTETTYRDLGTRLGVSQTQVAQYIRHACRMLYYRVRYVASAAEDANGNVTEAGEH